MTQMKKAYLLFALTGIGLSTGFSQNVKLNAELKLTEPVHMAYLSFRNADQTMNDSAVVNDGKVVFTEDLEEPVLATFFVRFKSVGTERPRIERMQLYLEPGVIKISAKDSLKFATVTGSKSNLDFKKLEELEKPFDRQERAFNDQFMRFRKDKDEEGMKKVREDYEKMSILKNEKVFLTFLKANPSSIVSLYALNQYAGYDLDPVAVEPLFKGLSQAVRTSFAGKAFKQRIEAGKNTAVGAYAMDFTQNDTLGRPVSLSSFKGKYVLLDFWASWCGPCRAENPNVVKAFDKYRNNNFTVLSVSLDQPGKKQAWLDAIHKDGLTWTHVSDLKFWNNEAAKQYGIRGIPANFLIDPSGKIIGKNLRGEDLEKKLEEVLPKS